MARNEAYYEAEKKIEEALKSGATELNLAGEQNTPDELKLQELPESIGKLANLQTLILVRNKLSKLPDSVSNLKQLQSLQLSDNNLTALPTWLGQLTQLQTIDASRNQFTDLPESMKHLTNLRILDISRNHLATLPEWLGQLIQLQKLILWKNELTSLPVSIKQLTQLQKLYLHENKFREVPEWIGQLRQLDNLLLYNNQLTNLPESLGQLTQLTELNLINNQLTTLPESLRHLTQLQLLNLENNQLIMLPRWIGQLTQLKHLNVCKNQLTSLPESIGELIHLIKLELDSNHLTLLPESLAKLQNLQELWFGNYPEGGNPFKVFPESIQYLHKITILDMDQCELSIIPDWISELTELQSLYINGNQIVDLPLPMVQLEKLQIIDLRKNPLNPELAKANEEGLDAVKLYLRLKVGPQVVLNEAKLILVGEGEVGKSCLMDALLGNPWRAHSSTHGIEIQQIKVADSEIQNEIILNGWDFGGQRVYRPTHQLFFSAPAVYLVVWKPREGPQQGFVKEWIQLVKRREPSAKIIVVATHGGPQQRQPDIDRQELWDLFGKETVIDFFFVDSKPDEQGERKGIPELKKAIARVAAELPEVGRSVPKSFVDVRAALQATGSPYLPLDEVLAICRGHLIDDEIARLFISISHRLGHLTHYENDPALRDVVILRPDWLATAMSYVLDDEETRKTHGLVDFSRLGRLWDDPARPADTRYPAFLHRIFLRLMERFDLSYRVAGLSKDEETNPISLIAQLVQDNRPENDVDREWVNYPNDGNLQQVQICRIVDKQTGQSATAEGLFYQLIVRLHKYSIGRVNFKESVHWQRGLIIEDEYKSRAFLENIGNDVRITVRAPYPEGFLGMLTREVKYLVDSFWEGLRCDVMVPCLEPCGRKLAGTGLYEVEKLIDSKRKGRPEFPCPVCNEWQNIDSLLRNAPAATQAISLVELQKEFAAIKGKLDEVNTNTLRVLSQVNKTYTDLIQIFTDDAKEGPRLFSLFPLERSKFNPKEWIRGKFRLVLWCERSRLPLPVLNDGDMTKGVYDLDLDREWFKKASPYIKFLSGTLDMVLPIASSAVKLKLDDTAYKLIEEQLDFGKSIIDATIDEITNIGDFIGAVDSTHLEQGIAVRAENATLRELHALLKAKDPSFGGLVRVMNKRQEFLWVHEKFAGEY